ncbi:MAG: PilZ domain-containing protein [Pseudomonadota bacterium]|nr:PilZ domain-containing protein [Pseudomonadota bacterium]
MDESSSTQNRRSRRSQLMMQATLEISGRAIPVKLRNLSSDGARVAGDEIPIEGTELLFRKGELAVAGRVVWSQGKQAGINFDHKLDPVEVLNHVPAPRPRMQPEFRRPGLSSRAMTPSERSLAERWSSIPPAPPLKD